MPVLDSAIDPNLTAVVLAGGASSRFGTDKVLAVVPGSGRTMLDLAIEVASSVASRVIISGNERAEVSAARHVWVSDAEPLSGPLGGIISVMGHVPSGDLLVIPVDQPWLIRGVLRDLVRNARGRGRATCHLIGSSVQPLPVAFRVEQYKTCLLAQWDSGERSVIGAFKACGLNPIPLPDELTGALRDIDFVVDLEC